MSVIESLARGFQIGGALRQNANQREQGAAFQNGGWEGVAQTAAGQGDMAAVGDATGMQRQIVKDKQEQQRTSFSQAHDNATVLANVATSLAGVPYEQRRQRIEQMAPMLSQLGFQPEQIQGFDPTDENLQGIRAAGGQLSQYQDIREENGAIIGIKLDGTTEVIHQTQQQAPSGYRWTADGSAQEPIPGGPATRPQQTSGGTQYSPITPEQAQEYNLPGDGAGFVMGNNGLPRRVGGGGTFPADQRARVAVMYQPALEAAQLLEQMDEQAVTRRGSHTSDTPLGQDWGARIAEAVVPFDDGAAARAVGGADYNRYVSASSSFESAMLPILSGAAVVESEARRIIRSTLPQLNDTREVLADKARRRQQMLNGAALIGGQEPPFPNMGMPEWATRAAQAVQSAGGSDASGLESLSDEELDALEQELTSGVR